MQPKRPLCRVYPRVCGGTGAYPLAWRGWSGLSPRVRGNRFQGQPRHPWAGSIPACAGEPPARDISPASLGVYPRVCGGTLIGVGECTGQEGLSPRVRGNRIRHGVGRGRPGSIPACAGEPNPAWRGPWPSWVYPRVCGGTLIGVGECTGQEGLSPRVRGNRIRHGVGRGRPGSIPACAGEP